MGTSSPNLLSNSGLETCTGSAADGWAQLPFSTSASAGTQSGDRTHLGSASIQTTARGSGMYQEATLQAGTTYTFSGYVNTCDMTAFDSGGSVYLGGAHGRPDRRSVAGEPLAVEERTGELQTDASVSRGWERSA